MKIVFASTFNAENIHKWSGTPYHMAKALADAGNEVVYAGDLDKKTSIAFKFKRLWKQVASGQRESPRFNIQVARQFSRQISQKLSNIPSADVIIAPQVNPIAYLDCKQPIVLWTDSLYASLIGFYPGFSSHSATTIKEGNAITEACLSRCRLAVFSSDWAARTAAEIYGIQKNKIKVIPFGANLRERHHLDEIRQIIKSKSRDCLKLLFIGKSWDRKGGDIVFKVTKALHALGQKVELHFVGCLPPPNEDIPDYIKCHGFISKQQPEGLKKMMSLLRDAHFLFVPSRAEAYGIVFCEANAFALPCLTTHVGGISTIVQDDINGKTFGLDAPVEAYCSYLTHLMGNYTEYEYLALSSFNEFEKRLNWQSAVSSMQTLLKEMI